MFEIEYKGANAVIITTKKPNFIFGKIVNMYFSYWLVLANWLDEKQKS